LSPICELRDRKFEMIRHYGTAILWEFRYLTLRRIPLSGMTWYHWKSIIWLYCVRGSSTWMTYDGRASTSNTLLLLPAVTPPLLSYHS
jgi:hypothetical protein